MKRSPYHDLLEAAFSRPLTPEEERQLQAHFASHPGDRACWEEEMNLTQLLAQLPPAPVPSNFTAQVRQAVERELNPSSRAPGVVGWPQLFRRPWVKAAAAAAFLCAVGLFLFHEHQSSLRAERARSVAAVSQFAALLLNEPLAAGVKPKNASAALKPATMTPTATVPSLEMLRNFDAINRLSKVAPRLDLELLAALQ